MEKSYLTIEEVAKQLGVHPKTIRRYINSGKIAALKVGGSWRIQITAIDEYMSTCEESSCASSVSKDDFCIFMDNDYFASDDILQVCSIVDYFVQEEDITTMIVEVTKVVTSFNIKNIPTRFNYIYDQVENKVRLVFWGSPTFMEQIMKVLTPYERK